ncbi:MAG: CdaR family protein [Turneriella sp.]|nr:CdaR family protein [Turneriella sp.]
MISRILKEIFITDLPAKLVCLILGAGIWFYVEYARVAQATLNIPVEYTKKPSNLYLKSGQPRFAKITVRGREEFLKFPTTGMKAEVNLSNAKSGEAEYPLLFDTRQLPERVEVVAKPEKIRVALEKGESRVLPVKVLTSGNPDPQFRVLRLSAEPTEMEVEGPEETMKALAALETEPVDLDGARATFRKKVSLRLPDQVRSEAKNVMVKIEIVPRELAEERQVKAVPLKIQNLDAALSAELSDKEVEILVRGEATAVRRLKASDFYAWVNLSDTRYNARTGTILPYATESGVPVRARILAGGRRVRIVAITPDKVTVRFSVRPEYARRGAE